MSTRLVNRHRFSYPTGFDHSEPRYPYHNQDKNPLPLRAPTANDMVHPAARRPEPYVQPGYDEAMRRERDLQWAETMAAAERGEMAYDHGNGLGSSPVVDRAQGYLDARAAERVARPQQVADAFQYGQQYLNNPLEEKGRQRIGRQFWEAPLGGHVRRGLEGQEIFGHTIDAGQARTAEQALAGLTAVGIGVPAFMAAVNQLSTPQDQGTIPF